MEGSDLRASRRSSFIADAMHKMSFTSNMTKAFSRMGRKLSWRIRCHMFSVARSYAAPTLSALEVAALANATAANEGVQNARLPKLGAPPPHRPARGGVEHPRGVGGPAMFVFVFSTAC